MLFYSFEFIYIFFPTSLAGYFFLGSHDKRMGIAWLVACSIFFYGWWNPKYIPFLLGSVLFNYLLGRLLQRCRNMLLLISGLLLNLSLIGYYKYIGFFSDIINSLSGSSLDFGTIVLPLGISFFTFQQIAWLVDSYKGKMSDQDRGLWEYALFVTFFPQLIAGPIVHHSEMMPQFHEKKNRSVNWSNMAAGLTVFIIGLSKKIVLADSLAPYANRVFDTALAAAPALSCGEAWIGALAYSLQLYFDFSGYADMAIGLGLMCNIRLPVNFDSPYKSLSISDFWRRWHITLSRLLRDYVYIPMGGNRKGAVRHLANLMLTMLIAGLWHGAGWTFILWGGLHGLFLVLHKLWQSSTQIRLPRPAALGVTFISIVAAWVVFRAESVTAAARILTAMADIKTIAVTSLFTSREMTTILVIIIPLLGLIFFLPNTQDLIGDERGGIRVYQNDFRGWHMLKHSFDTNVLWLCVTVLLAAGSIFSLLNQSAIHEFIYFQF